MRFHANQRKSESVNASSSKLTRFHANQRKSESVNASSSKLTRFHASSSKPTRFHANQLKSESVNASSSKSTRFHANQRKSESVNASSTSQCNSMHANQRKFESVNTSTNKSTLQCHCARIFLVYLLPVRNNCFSYWTIYSQTSLRRTPSGPASTVRLREVSVLHRLEVIWHQSRT